MTVLQIIRKEFIKNQPLKGIRISACLHVTAETANLAICLRDGGADVVLCASNPLSTQDDVAASLVARLRHPGLRHQGRGQRHLLQPHHRRPRPQARTSPWTTAPTWSPCCTPSAPTLLDGVIGGTEETTTGVIRLRAMAKDGVLKFPVIAVNDAAHQAPVRQPLRHRPVHHRRHHPRHQHPAGRQRSSSSPATAGAARASPAAPAALGADVIVTEVDPTKALEAVMDGFRVMPMNEAAKIGDVFITVTGNKHVIAKEHFEMMKDGAIVCNSGHFNVEIDIPALEKMAASKRTTRSFVDEYTLKDGRKINLLGEGRLINLAAAEGHPAIGDGHELRQPGAGRRVHGEELQASSSKKVYTVPDELDKRVAKLKLESMGIKIDKLTPEQEEYLAGWSEGT